MSDTYSSIKKNFGSDELEFPSIFFSNALKNVIYTMAGLEAVETKGSEEGENDHLPQMSGVILLIGKRNVMISIRTSKSMAATLVSFMTGIQREELKDEDLCDGMSELANMIAGESKAYVSGKGFNFTTLPPFTIMGDKHYLVHKNKVMNINKKFKVSNNDVFLKVCFL